MKAAQGVSPFSLWRRKDLVMAAKREFMAGIAGIEKNCAGIQRRENTGVPDARTRGSVAQQGWKWRYSKVAGGISFTSQARRK